MTAPVSVGLLDLDCKQLECLVLEGFSEGFTVIIILHTDPN